MLSTKYKHHEATSSLSTEEKEQNNLEFPPSREVSSVEVPESLFPSLHSKTDFPNELYSPDSYYRTWHAAARKTYKFSHVANIFPIMDDNVSTPRKPASSISVNASQSLPDIQTFFALWFKMTRQITSVENSTSGESRSFVFSFFSKNSTRRPHISDLQGSRGNTSPGDHKSICLETVMVGSGRCASGKQIIDWLVSSLGGGLDSR